MTAHTLRNLGGPPLLDAKFYTEMSDRAAYKIPQHCHLAPGVRRPPFTAFQLVFSFWKMSPPSKNDVRIRNFRVSDSDSVRELFMLGMARGRVYPFTSKFCDSSDSHFKAGSPRRLALQKNLFEWASYLAYSLILGCLVLTAQYPERRILGSSLSISVAVLFFGYRWMLSEFFITYYNNCLKTGDLADISRFYQMKPTNPDEQKELGPVGPSEFWVAEREHLDGRGPEIVGFVGLGRFSVCICSSITQTKITDCHLKDGKMRAELRRMVVSPHHRRLGIAALLIRTVIAHARKHQISAVHLSTGHFQHAAIRMYKKFGWVEIQRSCYREGIIKVILLEYRLDL